jgi:hypothetical protein
MISSWLIHALTSSFIQATVRGPVLIGAGKLPSEIRLYTVERLRPVCVKTAESRIVADS